MSRTNKKGTLHRLGAGAVVAVLAVIGATLFLSCGRGSDQGVPNYVSSASLQVQEAYAYAVEHPEVLQYMPCYCGCGAVHANNEECFVKERQPDGRVVYDPMGAG